MPPRPRPWFRFYSEAADSLKVHELPDRLVKPWLIMLCLANVNTPRGRLPSPQKVAFKMRVKEEKAKALIADLVTRHFIDYDGAHYVMHEWDDWQKDRDVAPSLRDGKRDDNHAIRDESVTEITLEKEEEKEEEKEREKDKKQTQIPRALALPQREVVMAFEQAFGRLLTPTELELVKALEEEHPKERIEYALREAAALHKTMVRYVQRTCERMANDGSDSDGADRRKPAAAVGAVGVADRVSNLERLRSAVAARERGE